MKTFALLALALCFATRAMAQSDGLGTKLSPMDAPSQTTTAIPRLLQGEAIAPAMSDESSASSPLEARDEVAPAPLSEATQRRNVSFMQTAGYGFGAGFGFGAGARMGRLLENGVYLGAMWQANATALDRRALWENDRVASQITSVEFGFEFPVMALGFTFRNRVYLSLGTGFANETLLPFIAAGNLFYYRFRDWAFIRGLTFGVDARLMSLGGANAMGLFFTTGVRLF